MIFKKSFNLVDMIFSIVNSTLNLIKLDLIK